MHAHVRVSMPQPSAWRVLRRECDVLFSRPFRYGDENPSFSEFGYDFFMQGAGGVVRKAEARLAFSAC